MRPCLRKGCAAGRHIDEAAHACPDHAHARAPALPPAVYPQGRRLCRRRYICKGKALPAAVCLSSLTRTWLAAAALCMAVLPQLPRRRKPNQSPCIKSYSNSCGLVHGRVAAAAAAAAAPRHGGTSGSGLVWQNIHTYVMVWQYIHTYLSCHYYGWSVCSMLMTGTNSA